MYRFEASIRVFLIVALAAGLIGCQDSYTGKIRADRGVVEKLNRANSDHPTPSSKPARKRPDLNDRFPRR